MFPSWVVHLERWFDLCTIIFPRCKASPDPAVLGRVSNRLGLAGSTWGSRLYPNDLGVLGSRSLPATLRTARFLHEHSILIFGCIFTFYHFNPPTFQTRPGRAPPEDAVVPVSPVRAPIAVLEWLAHIVSSEVGANIDSAFLGNCGNRGSLEPPV